MNPHPAFRRWRLGIFAVAALTRAGVALAETTNAVPVAADLPNVGASLVRVLGALLLVTGVFLGGVWLFRNWQRLTLRRQSAPRLNVIEARSLGGRHALYVVGYERERFLLAASPAGVSLLSHLPAETEGAPAADAAIPSPVVSFPQTLAQLLKGR